MWRSSCPTFSASIAEAMLAVRIDTSAMPVNIRAIPTIRPAPLRGTTSPYPTVVTVVHAHHSPSQIVGNRSGSVTVTATAEIAITTTVMPATTRNALRETSAYSGTTHSDRLRFVSLMISRLRFPPDAKSTRGSESIHACE